MGQVKNGSSAAAKSLVHLAAADLKRLPRPRGGFEAFAESLVTLAQKKAGTWRIPGFDAEATLAELAAYRELEPVVSAAQQQLAMAQETRLLHGSNAWRTTLRLYHFAQAAAPDDPDIQFAIAAFEAFMKRRPKRSKKPTTPPATPPTTPVAT